jgi:hypothetical protein
MQNLLLKTPYKFKKSYGGTPEPQTAHDAPWLHGPSLLKKIVNNKRAYFWKSSIEVSQAAVGYYRY